MSAKEADWLSDGVIMKVKIHFGCCLRRPRGQLAVVWLSKTFRGYSPVVDEANCDGGWLIKASLARSTWSSQPS